MWAMFLCFAEIGKIANEDLPLPLGTKSTSSSTPKSIFYAQTEGLGLALGMWQFSLLNFRGLICA